MERNICLLIFELIAGDHPTSAEVLPRVCKIPT